MRELGIGNSDYVVLYDHSNGQFVASARVWWTFRVFGHNQVSCLAGGFANWPPGLRIPPRSKPIEPFVAEKDHSLVLTKSEVLQNIESRTFQIVDARSENRFYGRVDEPRPDVPRGSIPYSYNMPYLDLFNTMKKRLGDKEVDVFELKPADELGKEFEKNFIDLKTPVATSCGSGITACVVALAAYHIGAKKIPVYDGSWTEWGVATDTPKVVKRAKMDKKME